MTALLEPTVAAAADTGPVPPRRRWRPAPFHVAAALAAAGGLMLLPGSVGETDVFWHVPLGHEILHAHRVHGLGNDWSLLNPGPDWTTSEWLGEVLLAALHGVLGWRGIALFRLAATALLLLALARQLLPRHALFGSLTFAVIALPIAQSMEERPLLVALLFVVWLSSRARAVLAGDGPPRWWAAGALSLLWANIHGTWVLGPAVLGLAAGCLLLDRRVAQARRVLPVLAAMTAAGCVNPLGVSSLWLPLTLKSATSHINEWHPTQIANAFCLPLIAVTVALVVSWARCERSAPRSEIAYTLAVFAFGTLAWRNVFTATLLLAPLAVDRLAATFRGRQVRTTRRDEQLIAVMCAVITTAGVAGNAYTIATSPVTAKLYPTQIAAELAADHSPHRVVSDYNLSGFLISFAGPNTDLAIDGRADRWGGDYIEAYNDLLDLKGETWPDLLQRLAPTDAVLGKTRPLARELQRRGWTVRATDGAWVLLHTPPAQAHG